MNPRAKESGQAVTEYILLLLIVVSFFVAVNKKLVELGLMAKLSKPLQQQYSRAYQYGLPDALGPEDGGPDKHPRAPKNGAVRIFYVKNPQ